MSKFYTFKATKSLQLYSKIGICLLKSMIKNPLHFNAKNIMIYQDDATISAGWHDNANPKIKEMHILSVIFNCYTLKL